jgi:predicted acetyltransferase
VKQVGPEESGFLHRLWQLYCHDLSEFRDSLPDGDGLFPVHRLEAALGDGDFETLLIFDGRTPIGFVVVRGLLSGTRSIREFFIVRGLRRQRAGYNAALHILRQFPGPWRIAFQEGNPGAAKFWRHVVVDLTNNQWSEERIPVPDKPTVPPDTWLSFTVTS